MARFLFCIPDQPRPTGGVNVILEFDEVLREAGVESEVVCSRPDYRYPFVSVQPRMLHDPRLRRSSRWLKPINRLRDRLRPVRNGRLSLRPDDVIVVPEFEANRIPALYPSHRCILLIQGYSIGRVGVAHGWSPDRFVASIATSRFCAELAARLGMHGVRSIPVSVDGDRFRSREPKRAVIAYMPRKRQDEARVVVELLRRRGHVGDYELRPIDGLTSDEVAKVLAEARFFLSFSKAEGFGLPPAEAMAAGCIVIGYTGVGGDEFFDDQVGVPVPDGDLVRYVDAVEAAVREYDEDPARLDAMRLRAAERIRARYGHAGQKEAVLSVFRALDRELSQA